jgi:hypothetical protein
MCSFLGMYCVAVALVLVKISVSLSRVSVIALVCASCRLCCDCTLHCSSNCVVMAHCAHCVDVIVLRKLFDCNSLQVQLLQNTSLQQ